ncbi:DME family drug/metabolite transporter [Kribbella sp. VKM Ac-2569]|uniref:EamA family transporter n=1 Tax=Kribbella sp. VKM Ac-2569 TaxID=2512220 RepID=UPI00102BFE49|nr:DMT family transporter [Kribbella sp. VKM Ac-2569]RZT17596.1 DME family drug/metabolite transporter [Kribbella sp. VKM Ac-2569]
MHHRLSTRRALVYVVLAALAWGTGGPTGALLSQYAGLTPLATSFWRLAAAVVWLAFARLAVRRTALRPVLAASPLRHVLSGLGLAVCQLGYFTAIPRVGVGVATVIALGSAPIFITVAARERLTPALFAAVVGLVLLSATSGTANLTGLAAAVASAAGYSLTTLLNRNTPDPLTTALLGFTAGALFLAPFAALPTTPIGWLLIAYFGLVPTAFAYTLFYVGLRTLKASTASVLALLEPVVAAAIGILAFHERLTPLALLGAVVLLLAVAAQSRR